VLKGLLMLAVISHGAAGRAAASPPPSRVVINEITANPEGGAGAHCPEDRNEFVELFNRSDDTIDLQGWRFTDFDQRDTLCAWTDTMLRNKYAHVRTHTTLILPHSYALIMDPEYTDSQPRGGCVQPYRLTDRLLIVRPGNTTIGNGLSNDDPLMLWSPDSTEISTFGVSARTTVIPCDAGDGISWERTFPDAADDDTTWYRSRDPTGSTPGKMNSITTYRNLTCTQLLYYPLSFNAEIPETLAVSVRNSGRSLVTDWSVRVFWDRNQNDGEDGGELIALMPGRELPIGQETTLTGQWLVPEPGRYSVVAELRCAGDQDSSDNRQTASVSLTAAGQAFSLGSDRFGPNLRTGPDSLVVVYGLPDAKGYLSVRAYDLDGRQRAQLFEGRIQNKDGRLVWNGADKAGTLLPIGLYVIALEYKSGRNVILQKKTVVLAKGR
jgi:hypothetical protein